MDKTLTKFIEVCAEGVGTLGNHFFEFDAKKIQRIGKAEAEMAKEKIIKIAEGESKKLQILNRAKTRFRLEQYNKQVNLENTFAKTKDLLEGEEVSDEPVEKDWIARFMGIAQNISREDIQDLLAKILAGEIKQPNSYSYRTLEVLKNLTKEELLLFRKFAIISNNTGSIFLTKQNLKVGFYEIKYTEILKMIELDLLQSSISSAHIFEAEKETKFTFAIRKSRFFFLSKKKQEVKLPALLMTDIGKDIAPLFETDEKDTEYIHGYLEELKKFFEKHKNLIFESSQ